MRLRDFNFPSPPDNESQNNLHDITPGRLLNNQGPGESPLHPRIKRSSLPCQALGGGIWRNRITSGAQDRAGIQNPTRRSRLVPQGANADRLSLIRRKIASGYYNTTEHVEKLADILIEKLGYMNRDGSCDVPDANDQ